VDWLVILAALAALAAMALAVTAFRRRGKHQSERVAAWQAGLSESDLRALAGLAATARTELHAGEVEVVLAGTGDGVVVTGSHVSPHRLGQRVPRGNGGLAGRGIAAGRTTLADDHDAMSVPIVSRGSVVGVVTASVARGERPFGAWHVARLEALAEEAGLQLGPSGGVGESQLRH
jgi:hypothetical protein